MSQLQDEDYVADVVPTTSQSDSNKEIDDGPLPTSAEVFSALALDRRYCVNMQGCGLNCSDSLDNVEARVLSQAAKSETKENPGLFCSKVGHASDLVGRLGLGWISDKKLIERRKVMLLNYLLTGILMHLAPLCTTYAAVTAIAVAMALAGGSTITLFSVLFFEYLGIRLMPLAYGLSNFAAGNANFFRPSVIGYYRDSHGKYDGLFQLLGSFQLFVSFLWLLSCVVEKMKKHSGGNASKQDDDAL
ncbi:hypothetical protein HPB50_002513 [Hyalomma asiaticum]|uniref:Uncharacterized protein n=1 Tax=Hyalomma asiaticum TaxID=266040 RepID=A0ACB7SH70_HYAAI|nr:hypothetical protein HPB50_002513 [Hyalomma asiaticum]